MEKNNITYFYLLIYSKETLNGYIRSEAQWLPWKEEDWELDIRGRIILLRLHISQGSSQKWIQDCVCVCVCVCTYILFQILLRYRLLQDTEYSSLCHIVGPCLFYV